MRKRRLAAWLAIPLLLCGCADAAQSSEAEAETAAFTETTAPAETSQRDLLSPEEIAALPAGTSLTAAQIDMTRLDEMFTAAPISDTVFARINGISYQENSAISREQLRYLRLLHYTPDGGQAVGEMIVNAEIAEDVCEIFRALYDQQYGIERMLLIDVYSGSDAASMADNNTCCFNYRTVEGSTALSSHARGMAIDLNPYMNPCVSYDAAGNETVQPVGAEAFADRSAHFGMKIDHDDPAYKLFTAHGFTWGGDWTAPKDYQHFERAE